MLVLPALLLPKKTVMGASRILPVSRHALKFLIESSVSIQLPSSKQGTGIIYDSHNIRAVFPTASNSDNYIKSWVPSSFRLSRLGMPGAASLSAAFADRMGADDGPRW
jgi:hypothetical protein